MNTTILEQDQTDQNRYSLEEIERRAYQAALARVREIEEAHNQANQKR